MSDFRPVRDAYASKAQQYIALSDDGWPDDEEDSALVRHHLTGLGGPVLDLGCGPGHWTADLQSRGPTSRASTWSRSSSRTPGPPILAVASASAR